MANRFPEVVNVPLKLTEHSLSPLWSNSNQFPRTPALRERSHRGFFLGGVLQLKNSPKGGLVACGA